MGDRGRTAAAQRCGRLGRGLLGDQAEDLAAIGASYGEELLGRVLALSGGALGGDVPGRVSTIRGTSALQQALCAQRDGDEEELADGLTGYR
ncbi:hypothetical protein GCM10009787_39450 [Streptomyces bangladeshensis]|uniref:Uncharacterized protein n=1 Tax=Streptomyces bangladeshensis TaxID=295352 RepID=A0ABN3BNF8_9ACTN